MTEVIVSITTIPKRKEMFLQTLPFILQQKYVKKICINLDNNLTQEDYDFYDKHVATQDSRIEINKTCESKWRSANKLLPTIQKYPTGNCHLTVTFDGCPTNDAGKRLNKQVIREKPYEKIIYDCMYNPEITGKFAINQKYQSIWIDTDLYGRLELTLSYKIPEKKELDS